MLKRRYSLQWRFKRSSLHKLVSALTLAIIVLVGLTPALEAQSTIAEATGPTVNLGHDDSALEVGVWFVREYENCGNAGLGSLAQTTPDALGLANTLSAPLSPVSGTPYQSTRWTVPIVWGDGNAWEMDWTSAAAHGQENSQVDSVDFAYFAGHGSKNGFFFGKGGNKINDCQATAEDAAHSWGDLDNDWIGISACNVLADPFSNVERWVNAMHGTRLVMGFKTVMADVPFGFWLGDSIRRGHTFTYAWFRTTDLLLPATQTARILAEHPAYFNDRPNANNAVTIYDDNFAIWTHNSGQNEALPGAAIASAGAFRPLTVDTINGEMPVFLVEPLSAAEANQQYATVANAFGLPSTVPEAGQLFAGGVDTMDSPAGLYASPDGDLLMDPAAGNFEYANSDRLWNEPETVQAAGVDGMMAIDDDTAVDIANNFLQTNNLMPDDAFSPQAQQEVIVTAQQPGRSAGAAASFADTPLTILQQDVANYQVSYARVITFTPPAASGTIVDGIAADPEPVGAQVVGPGAKLMVYVSPQVPLSATAASLMQDEVLGAMGGYRRVQEATVAGTNAPLTTPILPLATIKTLFDKIERNVALSFVPLPYDSRQVIGDSLSYWEGPIGWNQDQLIPVYVLQVRATSGTGAAKTTQDYDVYIPVNQSYMPPYAAIKPPTDNAFPGTAITLEAEDAGKTLAQLGIDPSLDFVLGSGESDSYLYTWYVNDVSDDNMIGNGRTITFTPPSVTAGAKPVSLRVILTVTDAGAPRTSGNTGTDEITFDYNTNYIPMAQSGENK